MSFAELLPILQKLSQADKLALLEFLQADLDRVQSSSASSDFIHPHLQRKEDILVIETVPLNGIDFNP